MGLSKAYALYNLYSRYYAHALPPHRVVQPLALGPVRRHKRNRIFLRNTGLRFAFALPLHPRRGLLQCRLGQKVHNRTWYRTLKLNITGIKDAGAARLGGVVFEMPMSRHIVKVRKFVVIECPGDRIMLRGIDVITVVFILN